MPGSCSLRAAHGSDVRSVGEKQELQWRTQGQRGQEHGTYGMEATGREQTQPERAASTGMGVGAAQGLWSTFIPPCDLGANHEPEPQASRELALVLVGSGFSLAQFLLALFLVLCIVSWEYPIHFQF